MLGSLGLPEILFILVLALLVFGPKRLPKVGRTLGQALGEFRRATSDLKRSFDREMTLADLEEEEPEAKPKPKSAEIQAVKEPPESPVARTELTAED